MLSKGLSSGVTFDGRDTGDRSYCQQSYEVLLKPNVEFVGANEIPNELREEIGVQLRLYSVNLVGLRGDAEYRHCGSGTFVKIDEVAYIVTASHCCEALHDYEALGLVLTGFRHRKLIPAIPVPVIVGTREEDAWGPDVALIPIPASEIGSISARMSFSNLTGVREAMLGGVPDPQQGLWAVVGAPVATSDLANPSDLEFAQTVHWMSIDRKYRRGEWDYLDFGIPLDAPSLLESYGGVSGGGIWQVDVCRDQNGTWGWLFPPKLEGCAFYQTPPEGDRIYIRGHGRQTIYQNAVDAVWGLGREPTRSS